MNTIWIVIPILTVLMFDLGLTLKLKDFYMVVTRPKAFFVALMGQIVLLPLIALGLGWAFQLTPVFFIGLMLIACSPGGRAWMSYRSCCSGRRWGCWPWAWYAFFGHRGSLPC